MNDHEFLDFQPCMFMRCGHRQTVLGTTLPGGRFPYRAQPHTFPLSDGDVLVVHDDVPASWKETDGVALLVHGLGGDHRSGYMVRVAAKLNRCGVRVFRMDQRGCGAAQWLSAQPAHAGRSDDIAEVLNWVEQQAINMVPMVFSLSAYTLGNGQCHAREIPGWYGGGGKDRTCS